MRNFFSITLVLIAIVALERVSADGEAENYCEVIFRCHDYEMNKKINTQIEVEMEGHYTYMYLAQIFEHHKNYYPKVAKYFRAKSLEELSHAERFIQYQNQRGGNVSMETVTRYNENGCSRVQTVKDAFKCAMNLETRVTQALTKLHSDANELVLDGQTGARVQCSGVAPVPEDDLRLSQPILLNLATGNELETVSDWNDCRCRDGPCGTIVKSYSYVELAEMIAHEFLDHQLVDTKEIANHYHTLKNMHADREKAPLESWLFNQHLEL